MSVEAVVLRDDDYAAFGLVGAKKQVAGNASLGVALKECLVASGLKGSDAVSLRVGNLLFSVASSVPDSRRSRRELLCRHIASGALATAAQVTAAVEFCKKAPAAAAGAGDFDDAAAFGAACGLGVVVTDADLEVAAAAIIASAGEALTTQRYAFPIFSLLPQMKEGFLKWGDGKKSKEAFDAAVLCLLGPMTPADEAAKKAGAGKKVVAAVVEAKGAAAATTAAVAAAETAAAAATVAAPPAANPLAAREIDAARNSPALLAQHAAVVGGRVRTRFPPEPNGFLHIGHGKSMLINFELAFKQLGVPANLRDTTFRYDDTNPDAESQVYIDNQAENVKWMGWRPARTTHSSDYFDQLFVYAQKLITDGHAYVCHQTKADIEASREAARTKGRATDSPWRERPVAESLALFDAMRAGRYAEGGATLRLKIDMGSLNATLWDPVAYRIKFTPHPHTGDKWCVYPSYDYSHAVIDSIEHIDYSLW